MSDLVKRLEPCPFCGGEAAVLGGKFPPIGIRYGVNCRGKCGTFLDAREVHQSDAIRAWNGNRPRLRSEIERRDLQLEVASKAALKLADELARLRSEVERLTRERDEAHGYASRFLTSFVAQHCNPVPGWAPLHDLIGVLTQIDNASTVAREYRSNLTTLTARTREVLAPFAEYMSNGADLDNKGNPLSDNAGVGWVYLKIGDFRAANTLFNELKEKDNG